MVRDLILRLCCLLGVPYAGLAGNLIPNPDFEQEAPSGSPASWSLEGCKGEWSREGREGGHALRIQGTGKDSGRWRSVSLPLEGAGSSGLKLYHLSFHARREPGATGGSGVVGTSWVSRDFPLTDQWAEYSFTFALPGQEKELSIRLGQWMVKGGVLFDDIELRPAQAIHAADGLERAGNQPLKLGEGEQIENGVYRFSPALDWQGANYHRPLKSFTARFNSNRWCFHTGSEVIYRQEAAGLRQTGAKLKVGLCYHAGGTLRVEASRNGKEWVALGELTGERRESAFDLPASLFPSPEILIRLLGTGEHTDLQVGSVDFQAPLEGKVADLDGQSWLFEVLQSSPRLEALILARETPSPSFWLALNNPVSNALALKLSINGTASQEFDLPSNKKLEVRASPRASTTGEKFCEIAVSEHYSGERLFAARTAVPYSLLDDPRALEELRATGDSLRVRLSSSGWKIGRETAPAGTAQSNKTSKTEVRISAARGEFEPAQVVLSPLRDCTLLSASVEPLRDSTGGVSPVAVSIHEVAYVRVTHPTDSSCKRGLYPDPLPVLSTPLKLEANRNQPLWLTFHVPSEAKAGDHTGKLTLRTSEGETSIPLSLRVSDFTLPGQSHLKTALGLGSDRIARFHGVKTEKDKREVYEKYLQNFAKHRISPYSFSSYDPIGLSFAGTGAEKRPVLDFTKFDAAAEKWLGRFNSFRLPLQGMGGGTFESRSLGEMAGFKDGTPEYARLFADYAGQVERHLREKGWLDKAYIYWFDEPEPKDYEFVIAGMKKLKAAAPGLKRMLTEQVEPELMDNVDIWCPLTPNWTPEKVRERQTAGDECWWYICCGPRAPYLTEFIDHPGTELRLWAWQSWQYGVTGLLIWETCYWTSSTAFPPPQIQDPWKDPMSYPSGHPGFWGNGDGRFLYPPRREPSGKPEPCLDGPIDSIRWEALRDGIEDYEYLWLLRERIQIAAKREGETALVKEARGLLQVPESISKDLTHFTTDPQSVFEHRDRVARMIERLGERAPKEHVQIAR